MKKILFITKNMACGGVERTLLNLLGSLDRSKYSIELLLLEKRGVLLDLIPCDIKVREVDLPEKWRIILLHDEQGLKNGIRAIWQQKKYRVAIYFGLIKLWDRFFRIVCKKSLLYYKCLKNITLSCEDYDIVCDYHGYGHLTTYLAAKFEKAKKFTWIHIEKIDDAFYLARKIYPKFDGIFGVSPQCLTNFAQAFPEIDSHRLVILYNLILKDEIRRMSLIPPSVTYAKEGRFVMVSVGRLSTQKGFDLAIEAANILKLHHRRFLWIIIGEGPERAKLAAKIVSYGLEQDVILHGLDQNPYTYMALADLYVQTSYFEGFATTLSEAIILGKPIISTSFSGVDQQIIEGKNGILSDFDKDDLAAKLERMIDDDTLRRSFMQGCAEVKIPMDQTLNIIDQLFS